MKTLVVKIGSSSLTNAAGQISQRVMIEIVRQLAQLHAQGYQIVVVSSGAIATARSELSFREVGSSLPSKQMLASIGQVKLMQTWSELFTIYEIRIGQILLTNEDTSSPKRATNAKNTFKALLDSRVIPIVNENDTVATEEICFGDNDTLSALVAEMVGANYLILLTDQEGLYTHDPRFHPEARLIESIEKIDENLLACAQGSVHAGSVGTGGMATKVKAARLATAKGITVTIASAKEPNILLDLVAGKKIGTTFLATSG